MVSGRSENLSLGMGLLPLGVLGTCALSHLGPPAGRAQKTEWVGRQALAGSPQAEGLLRAVSRPTGWLPQGGT